MSDSERPQPPLCPDGVDRLPREKDDILEGFLAYLEGIGLEPYPAQEEGILALLDDESVILNTPTGSGKSLVAAAMHYKSLCQGRRSYYTCPIKALVNEKFLSLCRDFGAAQVGLVTGDATVNPGAPIICCTAEILANVALAGGVDADVDDVIMDEFHYYSDRDRGTAWQVPLLILEKARFLLMSATLGETEFFEEKLRDLTKAGVSLVKSVDRPVPLEFRWEEEGIEQVLESLTENSESPVYVVHFAQRLAVENAQRFLSLNFLSKDEKAALRDELKDEPFRSPFGKELKRYLSHGVGVHHAGMLPRYRVLVERLAQKGRLKVICGTDTLGVGINVPIRTVLFTALTKYDGQGTKVLPARDFHQIAGRAGRRGFDDRGFVVAMPPPHVIDNLKMERKASADPGNKKKKKFVKKKAPDGFVGWDEKTFTRLQGAAPEKLSSSFKVGGGMLLQVLGREGTDGCAAMRQLIRDSHEPDGRKTKARRKSWQIFRALFERKIVEVVPAAERSVPEAKLKVGVDLQDNFSLDQVLSLYVVDAIPLLDPEAADYHLDVLSLTEAIIEDPKPVLFRQLAKAKDQRMAELREEGASYEERMEALEEVEHPKPLRDFTYNTFNDFAALHPWIDGENIRPKSIAREMVERFLPFDDYIREYGLAKAEGVLLRHLMQVYKVLTKTVPENYKTDELLEIEAFLETTIRRTDSSLLDEWARLGSGELLEGEKVESVELAPPPYDLTQDERSFTVAARNLAFQITRCIEQGRPEDGAELMDGKVTAHDLRGMLDGFFEMYEELDLSPDGRRAGCFALAEDRSEIEQVFQAPGVGATEFGLVYGVDLDATREAGEVVFSGVRASAAE